MYASLNERMKAVLSTANAGLVPGQGARKLCGRKIVVDARHESLLQGCPISSNQPDPSHRKGWP